MSTLIEQLEYIKYFLEHRDLDEGKLRNVAIGAGIVGAGLVGHRLAQDDTAGVPSRPPIVRQVTKPDKPKFPVRKKPTVSKPIATSSDKPSPLKTSPFKGSRPHQESGWKAQADDLRKKAKAAGMEGMYKDKIDSLERTGKKPKVGLFFGPAGKAFKEKFEAWKAKKEAEKNKPKTPPKKRTRADWIRDGFVWHERSLSWIKKR